MWWRPNSLIKTIAWKAIHASAATGSKFAFLITLLPAIRCPSQSHTTISVSVSNRPLLTSISTFQLTFCTGLRKEVSIYGAILASIDELISLAFAFLNKIRYNLTFFRMCFLSYKICGYKLNCVFRMLNGFGT
jgi:hypothetical protein